MGRPSAEREQAEAPQVTTADVLTHMRVEEGLYVVGCFEKRVTLLSQQVRALNLVHSLRIEGLLAEGSSIAVIGGPSASCGVGSRRYAGSASR